MGASASKTAKTAGSAVRKYPTRPPLNTTTTKAAPTPVASAPVPAPTSTAQQTQTHVAAGSAAHTTRVQTSVVKNVAADARDPALAARLNTLGAVQPNPHYSPTSTSQFDPRRNTAPSLPTDTMMQELPQSAYPDPRNNPVLRVLESRQRIADEADEEIRNVGRRSFTGRVYLDAGLIQLALMRQARGEPDARIEEALGIKKGRLGVLKRGMLAPVLEE